MNKKQSIIVWLGGNAKKYIASFLALIVLSIIFYTLFPKYKFHYDDTVYRTNMITGRVEVFSAKSRKWINLSDNLSKYNTPKVPKWADIANDTRYKSASPELQIKMQDEYFDTFVKTAPGYKPEWESYGKAKLFGRKD